MLLCLEMKQFGFGFLMKLNLVQSTMLLLPYLARWSLTGDLITFRFNYWKLLVRIRYNSSFHFAKSDIYHNKNDNKGNVSFDIVKCVLGTL